MNSFVLAACLFACAYAAVESDVSAQVVKNDYHTDPEGGFQYAYETGNGITAQADGKLKPIDKDEVALEIQGSSQYKSPEGEDIQLTYVANEFGYQPQGAHLPTTPPPMPIPDYIARALEYIAAHPFEEKKQ